MTEDATRDEIERLSAIVAAAQPILDDIAKTVAGWHAMPGMDRHPDRLGCTLRTNCKTFYAIAYAMTKEESVDGIWAIRF